MQILVVESDADQRSGWCERLQEHTCRTCCNLAEAQEIVETEAFEVILCRWFAHGVALPNANDRTFQQLKAQAELLICIVDDADRPTEDLGYSIGFNDCLSMGCSDEQLQAKLRLADELGRLQSRLAQAQKLESIGELAAGIAHEINTPIQYVGDNTRFVKTAWEDLSEVMVGCQELIDALDSQQDVGSAAARLKMAVESADAEYLAEELPTAITQTLEGVDRVANIVRAMKEFAHPGASEMTLTELDNSITNTVMVARNEWKYVAELETDFDTRLPPVPCLPGEINQVLLNMIVNAAHAVSSALGESPEEKGKISIATRLAAPYAEIRITDSGTGIQPENVSKIFNPFFTTKAAGKGTGQGLAIAHSVVVDKHGGSIGVESQPGQGTTFIIRLPLEHKSNVPSESLEAAV